MVNTILDILETHYQFILIVGILMSIHIVLATKEN